MYFVLFSLITNPYFMDYFFNLLKAYLVLAVIKISSAYAVHCFSRVEMFPLALSFLIITSMAMLKREADKGTF
jgi:uncharacterized membrane protein SirB2